MEDSAYTVTGMIRLVQNATEFDSLFRILNIFCIILMSFQPHLFMEKEEIGKTDNWQPKVQITKASNEGLMSLENREGISELCKEFASEEKHIVATLEH